MTAHPVGHIKPNPPLAGHGLLHEGHVWSLARDGTFSGDLTGGCRCGAKPDGWPNLSVNAVKRWHRQHKADLRAQS